MNSRTTMQISKSGMALRTIGEVSADLNIPPHVLRFWETKFPFIRPVRPGRGRRYYRPEDVELLCGVREFLYTDGYTIKGVQKMGRRAGGMSEIRCRGGGEQSPQSAVEVSGSDVDMCPETDDEAEATGTGLSRRQRIALQEILTDLESIRAQLSK